MAKVIKDLGASVRARLLRISKQMGVRFDFILNRYAVERFLHRISLSEYSDQFVLKGATLVLSQFDAPFRMTRDLDLMSLDNATSENFESLFMEILDVEVHDGINFDRESLVLRRSQNTDPYSGVRLQLSAELDRARIKFGIDVKHGDATEPGLEEVKFPVLLDMPAPYMQGYSLETVIAEKFHAMVTLGMANSRIKDYVDIFHLSQSFKFERLRIAEAVLATFASRQTKIPIDTPPALSEAFVQNPMKVKQWEEFKHKSVFFNLGTFANVVKTIEKFVMPVAGDAIALSKKGRDKPVAHERALPYLLSSS